MTMYQIFVWKSVAKSSEFTANLRLFWFGRFGAFVAYEKFRKLIALRPPQEIPPNRPYANEFLSDIRSKSSLTDSSGLFRLYP